MCHPRQPFVLAFTMCGVTVYVCVCARVRYPHCPLLVGDHFATVAVGDQMANWALCHVTSLHWGPSQSAQARLLNCRRPHRHHSPILTESSLRAPEGPFQRLTERALLQLIRHQATGLFTFSQPEWLNLCVCVCARDSLPCSLLIKSCQIPRIYDAAIGRHILGARFKARLQMLRAKLTQALSPLCHRAGSWLALHPWHHIKNILHSLQTATCIGMPASCQILCCCGFYCYLLLARLIMDDGAFVGWLFIYSPY